MARISKKQQDQQPQQNRSRGNSLKIKIDHLKTVYPLTNNQKSFFESYRKQDSFIALHGFPGTGKTFCALYKALEEVLEPGNSFEKVLIIRSAVQGRELGHTPGSVDEKMALYETPYIQICSNLFERADAYTRLCEQGHMEFMSTSFLRGATFDNSIIIVDEMQNMNWQEISTIMTRVGNESRIIWCGDYRQTDLTKNNDKSGIHQFLKVAGYMDRFTRIEFGIDDICRSSLVKEWIIACDKVGVNTWSNF